MRSRRNEHAKPARKRKRLIGLGADARFGGFAAEAVP